tara:strand:- start:155 stop:361 length:207 start_codon:yes stop_codon:yes gene_type:complete
MTLPKITLRKQAMLRLEQITALVLSAALAIPSYWFFWTMAGGGGYERREIKENGQNSLEIPPSLNTSN